MLADAGRDVLVFERQPAWHWRACGVFASPAAVAELRRLGVEERTLTEASQPIPAMRVESQAGTAFRLTYGDDGSGRATAVGFDRSALDPAMLGIAPVPGGRVNVGIVLGGRHWRRALARQGASITARAIVGDLPRDAEAPEPWRLGPECEDVAGAWPLGHAVTRRAGNGWLLVGDAAGFLDPFTGEGIHRALVSARVAARAIL